MVYVPQAMLVEGRGVFSAVGRSFALASGNVRRLMAMTLFTFFATYSSLMLLMIPLGWYGYLNGVDLSPFGSTWPTWYAIGYQVILQCSHIMLAPIWMLGLSLLYVDERVRHEGYDSELMAARQLPEMPKLPGVVSPFAPALVTARAQSLLMIIVIKSRGRTPRFRSCKPHTLPSIRHTENNLRRQRSRSYA